MNRPADTEARHKALDTQQSFAVAAPAGAGKTGLLTQRLLCLLTRVEAPEQILCMTFTRKAAAEMRRRVINALVQSGVGPEPEAEYERQTYELARRVLECDARLQWGLIDNPKRLRIQTIDSFCRTLASQLAPESGFAELPEPVDDADKYYVQAIREVLAGLNSEGGIGAALGTILQHVDNDMTRLERLLMRLLVNREQWLPLVYSAGNTRTRLESAAQNLVQETLAELAQVLAPVGEELAQLADYAARNLLQTNPDHTGAKAAAPLTTCVGLKGLPPADAVDAWRGLADMLLRQDGEFRKALDKRSGFPTAKDSVDPDRAVQHKEAMRDLLEWCRQQRGLQALLEDLRYLPAAELDDTQWHVLEALTAVLPTLVAGLRLVFNRENVCDFTEVTLAALFALGEPEQPTDLTLRLDYQLKHILVDEFQDTSSIQYEILRRLVAGWQPDDGRTLFLVGDGMQSLYGFRNANVGLFLDARYHGVSDIPLENLDLTVNFRSQAQVIHWVNRMFVEAFPARENTGRGAVTYLPAEAHNAALKGPAVTIDLFEDDPDGLLQAIQVADCAQRALQADSKQSVAILVRSRGHLRQILPALREKGLQWRATDIDPLAQCMPVVDLMSLTRAMINPADRIAWLSILRAPWCALQLPDLLAVATSPLAENPLPAGDSFPLLLYQVLNWRDIPGSGDGCSSNRSCNGVVLSDEGQRILSRIAPHLSTAWQQRRRKPIRQWVEGLWLALGGPVTLNEQERHWCRQYLDLLEQYAGDRAELEDWPRFQAAVNRLYANDIAFREYSDQTPDACGLQIMTIHKAKGLEFDTVILPALDKATRGNDSELLRWRQRVNARGGTDLLLAPLPSPGVETDTLYQHIRREDSIRERLENTRVMYVACTRAIKKLHLLFTRDKNDNGEYKTPAKNSLLGTLWPALAPELDQPEPDCAVNIHAAVGSEAALNSESHQIDASGSLDGANRDAFDLDTDPDDSYRFQWRLPADWQAPDWSTNRSGSNASKQTPEMDTADPLSVSDRENRDARMLGTLFHRTLSQLVEEGVAAWDQKRRARQYEMWALQLGAAAFGDTDQGLSLLRSALDNCLNDTAHRWLFDGSLEDSACELILNYRNDAGAVRAAIVDRSFIVGGQRWVVDYKLAQPVPNQPRDQFLATQRQRYSAQLGLYAGLFSKLETRPVQCALYFPLISHLEPLDTFAD